MPGALAPVLLCSTALLASTNGCAWIKVATGPKWSDGDRLAAPPAETTDHRGKESLLFLVLGDGGTGRRDQKRVAAHMADECRARGGCDFVLMAGDNIYFAGVKPPKKEKDRLVFDSKFIEKFEIPYGPLGRLDFWIVPGNHDWYTKGSVDSQVLYSASSTRWRMPAHDYEVPKLPEWMHIYGLDTVKIIKGRRSGQVDRAREGLCGREGWRLLFGHHPLYTSGVHGNTRGVMPKIEEEMLEPLIEQCGVQIYFAGHDHHQEHLSSPAFDQIIQGAAGKLRRVREIKGREPGVRQLAAASRLGFALVHATPDSLQIRFFGYNKDLPYREFHCRYYDLKNFADPRIRSRPCDDSASGEAGRGNV